MPCTRTAIPLRSMPPVKATLNDLKSKFKWIIITFSSIFALVIIVIACGYSYFYIGFPPRKNGIERLNSISHFGLSDRKVYYGTTGGFDDWQEYFKFNATKEEVNKIVLQLKMGKMQKHSISHPSYYWWTAKDEKGEEYYKYLGFSYYLHYNPTKNEIHFAEIHE